MIQIQNISFDNFEILFLPCACLVLLVLMLVRKNKCSVGPETSRPEVEKLAARVSFPREKVFIPRSDSCVAEAGGRGYTVRPRNEFRGLTVV